MSQSLIKAKCLMKKLKTKLLSLLKKQYISTKRFLNALIAV